MTTEPSKSSKISRSSPSPGNALPCLCGEPCAHLVHGDCGAVRPGSRYNLRFIRWCPLAPPEGREGEFPGARYESASVWGWSDELGTYVKIREEGPEGAAVVPTDEPVSHPVTHTEQMLPTPVTHAAELLGNSVEVLGNSVEPVTHELPTPVTHDPKGVTHGTDPVTHTEQMLPTEATMVLPTALGGWTLCRDSRGIYKAVKRIDGKLKSVYVGKDPSAANSKIEAWMNRPSPRGKT